MEQIFSRQISDREGPANHASALELQDEPMCPKLEGAQKEGGTEETRGQSRGGQIMNGFAHWDKELGTYSLGKGVQHFKIH